MQPEFLVIGEILKPWGYLGEVKVKLLTDFPKRVPTIKTVYLGADTRAVQVEHARLHSGAALMKFAGIDSPEAAAKLRGQMVRIARVDAAPLKKGQYYHHAIIGLEVWTMEGEHLGAVSEILETGANDVYVVRRADGSEALVPAIKDVIEAIDLDAGRITIHAIPGLLE